MKRSAQVLVLLGACVIAYQALAVDEAGFMKGGGAGSLSCPEFLNAMATARQKGGAQKLPGVHEIDGFAQYILGFQTGFNSQAEGVFDIFSSFGSNPAFKALYAIEPWCASHPDKNFAQGLLALAATLRTKNQ